MPDEIRIEHTGNSNDGGAPAPVAAVIDQAREVGEHAARLDALGAAHETLKASYEDTRSTVEALRTQLDLARSTAEQAITGNADNAEHLAEVEQTLADRALEPSGGEPEPIASPPPVQNEASEKRSGFRSFLDKLNLH